MGRKTSVALQYDTRLPAPLVVARAKGDLADRMIRLAGDCGIPVVRSDQLADTLSVLDPGELIPEPFYQAVAEVLGFVWRNTPGGDGAHPQARADDGALSSAEPNTTI
ncbi:MAG: EscU/YscU/HrcU family type III secretion system export apparatus switch protein [Spirochaetota bacterium]